MTPPDPHGSEPTADRPHSPSFAQRGYRLAAEWEPHAATWLAWPHNRDDWPGKFGPIPWVYAEIIRHLARHEPVQVVVRGEKHHRRAEDHLGRAGVNMQNVHFFEARLDRGWLRDCGPFWVVQDADPGPGGHAARHLLDFRFNAWAKYDNWKHDDRLPRLIARDQGLNRSKPMVNLDGDDFRVVLEGGAIDVNGRGSLLTTEECLLSPIQERNPGLDRQGYERLFAENFGIRKVIWLGRGIEGDDTHGHVDDLARFVNPTTIVTVVEHDPASPNHVPTQDNLERLRRETDQDGQPFRIVELPMPRPLAFEGQPLPASYANFYIANGIVIVPTFNDPADREALGILADLFPEREVVGIHAVDLVWGLGTLHCLTRDEPRGPSAS